jgi:hypothetical protein
MRRLGYVIAFALVLVVIVAGTFFGGRFVVQRFRQDFQFRQEWSPPELPSSPTPEAPPETETVAPTARPAPTQVVVPTPVAPSPEPFIPTDTPTLPATPALVITPDQTQTPTPAAETATLPPTPAAAEPFHASGPARTSLGDCGGLLVLGLVSDANGAPLPGIRLRLVDEFANEAFAVTKSGQTDLGRYDFPMAGPPRELSLTIVDEGGSPLSRPAGFTFYGNAPDAQATCYEIDWQRR